MLSAEAPEVGFHHPYPPSPFLHFVRAPHKHGLANLTEAKQRQDHTNCVASNNDHFHLMAKQAEKHLQKKGSHTMHHSTN